MAKKLIFNCCIKKGKPNAVSCVPADRKGKDLCPKGFDFVSQVTNCRDCHPRKVIPK